MRMSLLEVLLLQTIESRETAIATIDSPAVTNATYELSANLMSKSSDTLSPLKLNKPVTDDR